MYLYMYVYMQVGLSVSAVPQSFDLLGLGWVLRICVSLLRF